MAQLDVLAESAKGWIYANRRALFWLSVIVGSFALMIAAGEITALLLFSYFIAVLVEPAVQRLTRRRWSRTSAIFMVGALILLALALLVLLLIPSVIQQMNMLIQQMPDYVARLYQKATEFAARFDIALPVDSAAMTAKIRESVKAVGTDQLTMIFQQAYNAVLSGYSITMMALNIVLVPFFVFYISVELPRIHESLVSLLPPKRAERLVHLFREIMNHVHAFFQGQVTVALCLAVMYSVGLLLVGTPSALAIGVLSGFLGVIPYLGILIGIFLATMISLVTEPSMTQLLLVWGVFAVVQTIESTLITPRVMGDKMGLHPLEVIVALLVGGQIFGLLGLLLAVPGVAAVRVIFRYLRQEVEGPEGEFPEVAA